MKIVVAARNGTREFECAPGEKILHAGLRSAVELPYECGTGTCGTCKARLASGRAHSDWPEAPGRRYLKHEAELLMCQSVADEDCKRRQYADEIQPWRHARCDERLIHPAATSVSWLGFGDAGLTRSQRHSAVHPPSML